MVPFFGKEGFGVVAKISDEPTVIDRSSAVRLEGRSSEADGRTVSEGR